MRMARPYVLVAMVVVALFALPMTASAFVDLPNNTANSYGLVFGGAGTCGCHNNLQLQATPHSLMVTDVQSNPASLVPDPVTMPTWWPTPTYGAGLSLTPAEMFLQIGDPRGLLEYVGNEGDMAVNPLDDLPLWDPLGFDQLTQAWELEPGGEVGAVAYTQRCGGCHNLGVTRTADVSQTLANGGEIGPNTPTAVNSLSIQCEVCHGSGENAGAHFGSVPEIVNDNDVSGVNADLLNAQVCGQCHVSGLAKETNVLGALFSTANGYTVDETLTDYFDVYSTVPTEGQFLASPSTYRFYPTGANRSMRHSYYNEWLQNKAANGKGHMDPYNNSVNGNAEGNLCIKCHSGQGFLYRIGATNGNNVVPTGASNTTMVDSQPTTTQVLAENFGISCQVCHTGHVGYNTAGDDVDFQRKWDSGETVTCEDCHNWQFEVMNQTLQTEVIDAVTYDRPALNASRVSHPQREMLHGGEALAILETGTDANPNGVWGVAPMGEFMPGAECKDCHMPDTYREGGPNPIEGDYIGAPATRQSHRFKVMEPGDAMAWGVRVGGDSCQPCHPSSSRTELEEWIVDTEAEVAAQVSAAQAGLTAVVAAQGDTRTWSRFLTAQPGTWTIDPTVYAVLQKAAQNINFVVNDGSGGIHNPAYAMAALDKAMEFTAVGGATLDIVASSDFVPSGSGVGLSGTLLDGASDPIANVPVDVEFTTDGVTWNPVATVMTNAMGEYAAFFAGPITGDTDFRAVYTVDGATIMSNVVTVGVVSAAGVVPERVAGATRFDTAVALSESAFPAGSVSDIVMASGQGFPDALSAAGLAGTVGSPIMLTNLAAVPASVMTEIDRLSATDDSQTTIWIVGGTGVVANSVVTQLEAEGYTVERVFGANRYETSAEVARLVADIQGPGFVDTAIVAYGMNFADALAVSPVAWANGMPILLTPLAGLDADIEAAYDELGYTGAIAVGGTAAVSANVVAELEAISGAGTVDRWFGANRFATAVAIANEAEAAAMADFTYVGVANGMNFPDALAGGPIAGSYGGVMILVTPTTVPAESSAFFTANAAAIQTVEIYGGTGAVSDGVLNAITALLAP